MLQVLQVTVVHCTLSLLANWVYIHRLRLIKNLMTALLPVKNVDLPCCCPSECPPGYRLGPLALKDANFVNRLWKHGTDRTLKRIKASIKSLLTAGIYTVTTNELVAWALQMDYGAIGNLQTLEGHQHQGLAKSLISHLTCEIVKGDMVPYCLIEESNVISKKLFQKMGFTLFPDTFVSWIDVVPM